MSRVRGPTNIPKSVEPLTGRRIEMHKLSKYLVENNLVLLHGPPGIGKTHLAYSVSYFLNCRYFFNNGNYYFDLTDVTTNEKLKSLLRDYGVENSMDDTLLIFDHIDSLWAKQGTQFRWWVIDLANRFKGTILIISRNKIDDEIHENFP